MECYRDDIIDKLHTGFCDSQCTNSNNEMNNGVSEDDSTLTWLAHNSIQATLMVNWTTSLSGKHAA